MPDAIVPLDDVLERVFDKLRERIKTARANGQHVRMIAREYGHRTMSMRQFQRSSLEDIVTNTPFDDGFEMHIYIEPKR